MNDTTDNKPERRPLTREERERMKRELKAQMRAYVDALKEQMLGAKDKGEKPDLDAAMAKAEKEAEKRLREEVAQGDPMVREAAAMQAAAQQQRAQQGRQRDVLEVANRPHDGLVPRISASAAPAPREEEEQSSAGIDLKDADEIAAQVEEAAKQSALPKEELERLTRDIIAALKTIYDPEIPVDIYELGLIYRIDIADDRTVTIDMTLTAPGCPVAGDMPGWVQKAVSEVEGVKEVKVNLVFDPPWDMSRMSDEARLALNMF